MLLLFVTRLARANDVMSDIEVEDFLSSPEIGPITGFLT